MFEKLFLIRLVDGDPPKSPFLRGTLIPVPPFLRGARGDLPGLRGNKVDFSNTLLDNVSLCAAVDEIIAGLYDEK
jgi:hypothetical protein